MYKQENGIFIKHNDFIVPTGLVLVRTQNIITGKITQELVKNMVVDAGKASIADHLRGTTSNNKGIITYCAVGTSGVAPARSDTGLTSELDRKQISVRSISGNVATFTTFFTTAEAIGTLLEAGLFGDDATDTADTGTLFSKLAINRTKTSNDTLTLAWSVTIGG